MAIRILLADDHALFRDGVAALLKSRGYEVVGEAADGVEAVELVRRLVPDLVLMDIRMPRLDGLAATRILTAERVPTRVVMLTVSDDQENLFEAIKSGAAGYILKSTDTAAFFDHLDTAAAGDAPISRPLAGKILAEFARQLADADDAAAGRLTERERQVLRLVSEGLTNRSIAAQLSLSENTVKYHLKNILQKLHLRNRAQAVAYALESGLLKREK